jgi:uncharacterized membrane protein
MPPLPPWNGFHPLVVHFPIALLTVAPVLVAIGLMAKHQRPFLTSALVIMALGTAGAWLAVASGEAAGGLAPRLPIVAHLVERHEEMAETSRTLFTVLTLVFAALVTLPWVLKREPKRVLLLGVYAAFMIAYVGSLAYLANTADQGGRLVHERGVHAIVAPASPGTEAASLGPRRLSAERAAAHGDD